MLRRRFNKSVQFEALVVKRSTLTEPYAQCLACHYGETIPMERGWLDIFVGQDGCRHYGKFKQTSDEKVWHNCGDKWSLCELIY